MWIWIYYPLVGIHRVRGPNASFINRFLIPQLLVERVFNYLTMKSGYDMSMITTTLWIIDSNDR